MGKKIVKIGLSAKEIDRAISELAEYKRSIQEKTKLLQMRIAERLAAEAENGFAGAILDDVVTGGTRYAQVDVSINDKGSVTVVVANGEDAVWVEFGAGVYHNGAPGSSPNPSGAELGLTIGSFGKGNGKKNVWGFYEEDELVLTHGTPAAMPISKAVAAVCGEILQIAKEIFQ